MLQRLLADRVRLPHALMVHGPAGIGKTEFARALAAGALCESPRDGLACESCPSCHWFSQGNHPDYREVVPEAAMEDDEPPEVESAKAEKARSLVIKIDQIRAVADFMALSTHRAGYRVLVVNPAESMHPAAANSLLKTLEEPPAGSLIVMVSDRIARLLPTIRSRCRLLALPMPAQAQALAWLEAEGIARPQAALAGAGGAPLLARELAQPEEAELRRRLLQELSKPSGADVLTFASTVERTAIERIVYWMQTWIHDLVQMRLAGSARHHVEFLPALQSRARDADLHALLALDRDLVEARRLASHPLNPRLVAEHLLMAYNRATSAARP